MTRRARMGPIQTLGRGVDRMAPGGRRSASESPIRPFYRTVGEAGAVEPETVPPTTYGAFHFAGEFYNFPTGTATADAWSPTRSAKTAGDMFLSVIVADSSAGAPSVSPPAGWEVLGSGSSGTTRWIAAGISSYTGSEGGTWSLSGLVNEDVWSGYSIICYHLKGGAGWSWTAVDSTAFPGTRTGTWLAPDPSWAGSISLIVVGDCDATGITPVPANTVSYGYGGSRNAVFPNPDAYDAGLGLDPGEIFTAPRPTGSFTINGAGKPGTGAQTFAVTVGLV